MGTPTSYCSPTEATPGGSGSSGVFVSLMLGMLLCLLGVQCAWVLRTSDNHWKSGAAAAAWTGVPVVSDCLDCADYIRYRFVYDFRAAVRRAREVCVARPTMREHHKCLTSSARIQ